MSRRPVPLMFIHSPAAIMRMSAEIEESTSVFVKNVSEASVETPIEEKNEVLPVVENQLKKIESPFGRHLYQPVQLKLINDQSFIGTVEKVEGQKIHLTVDGEVVVIESADVLDILWRGKSIPEK